MAICVPLAGVMSKPYVQTLAKLENATAPVVAFYRSTHQATSIPAGGGGSLCDVRTTDAYFEPQLRDSSGVFSFLPTPTDVRQQTGIRVEEWGGIQETGLKSILENSHKYWTSPSKVSLVLLPGLTVLTFPLAQCWGGLVDGYIDLSFTVAKAPQESEVKVAMQFFTGYRGTDGAGKPVEARPTGTDAREICEGATVTITSTSTEVLTDPSKPLQPDPGADNYNPRKTIYTLTSPTYEHMIMPIKYARKTPYAAGAMDNQYVALLYADQNDPELTLTDISVTFVAKPAITPINWERSDVPISANTPLL